MIPGCVVLVSAEDNLPITLQISVLYGASIWVAIPPAPKVGSRELLALYRFNVPPVPRPPVTILPSVWIALAFAPSFVALTLVRAMALEAKDLNKRDRKSRHPDNRFYGK